MAKRQRQVFGSHSQCAHVWAQQTQESGRAGNVFFEGPAFYSYGHHYKAAQIHKVRGKTFALYRSDPYSPSTNKHLIEARNALSGLMPHFASPDVTSVSKAIEYLDNVADSALASELRSVKVASESQLGWKLECIERRYSEANDLRKIVGRVSRHPKKQDWDAVCAHLRKRLARYQELNTPEMIKARQAKALAKVKVELDAAIQDFRSTGQIKQVLYKLPHELLRVQGDEVITSRGARVPVVDAKLALSTLRSFPGQKPVIGHFSVESVSSDADPIVKVGCHRILMSEALRVVGEL